MTRNNVSATMFPSLDRSYINDTSSNNIFAFAGSYLNSVFPNMVYLAKMNIKSCERALHVPTPQYGFLVMLNTQATVRFQLVKSRGERE